jgi:hypothetical protein
MPWTTIPNSDVDAESPLTESLATRWRDNPEAVAEGHASVPYAKKILVPQALRTAETVTTKVARPDGTGGVVWVSDLVPGGMSTTDMDTSKILSPNGSGGMRLAPRSEIASASYSQAVAGVTHVLNAFGGPYSADVLAVPLDTLREYVVACRLVGEIWYFSSSGSPNVEVMSNVLVTFGMSLASSYPFPVVRSSYANERFTIEVSGGYLRLVARVDSVGAPVGACNFDIHRAEFIGIRA